MPREPGTLCRPAPPRELSAVLGPVLIQVPALPARTGDGPRPPRPLRRRRRLRREVRLAGSAALLALPVAAAAVLLGGARPAAWPPEPAPGSRTPAAVEAPPVVSIAMPIEPEAPVTLRERVPPVQFPDYVLPDDGSEEAAHAGS
jgi:hypothetical protein